MEADSIVSISDSSIFQNRVLLESSNNPSGGGIFVGGSNLLIEGTTGIDNAAGHGGGGISVTSGTIIIRSSMISRNSDLIVCRDTHPKAMPL